jgi:hypothetical protein
VTTYRGFNITAYRYRRYLRLSLAAPLIFVVVMVAITLGVGRLIKPLLLGYLLALGYIALAAADTWEQRRERSERAEGALPEGTLAK